jgi:hypothetical protein
MPTSKELHLVCFLRHPLEHSKHLCGEYPTASAFALWLAARIIREIKAPAIVLDRDTGRPVKSVLIVNSYFEKYHSLILLRAC